MHTGLADYRGCEFIWRTKVFVGLFYMLWDSGKLVIVTQYRLIIGFVRAYLDIQKRKNIPRFLMAEWFTWQRIQRTEENASAPLELQSAVITNVVRFLGSEGVLRGKSIAGNFTDFRHLDQVL